MFVFVLSLSCILFNDLALANVQRKVLDAYSLGVSCLPIRNEPEATLLGGIKVSLDELKLNDGQEPTDLKIPVLLFRYDDILNFTTLPSWEEYDEGYASNYSSSNLNWDNYFLKNSVDFEENKFILDLYEGYSEIDEKRIYNGFLDLSKEDDHAEALLPAYETGKYCAYVAPPINRDIKTMNISLALQFSKFYSTSMSYVDYCQLKYIIGTGLLLVIYLINNILKFKKDKQSDIKNMPIISKTVIFYVLIPLLSLMSLEWFVVFIEIHCNLSNRKISCFEYSRLIIELIQPNWRILLRFYVLLFTMGYGVIYYHKGASRTFSKMPRRTMNVAWLLFVTDLTVSNIENASSKFEKYLMVHHTLALFEDMIDFICTICFIGSYVLPFVWYFVSFIYYFKTRNIIKKLPPTSTVTEGIDANTRIMKAFKQSSLVIFISPTISGLAWFSSFVRMVVKTFYSAINDISSDLDINEKISSRDSLIKLVKLSHSIMLFSEDSVKSIFEKWPGAIKIYLTIALLYVIWIRNNNALVVEDEKADLKE